MPVSIVPVQYAPTTLVDQVNGGERGGGGGAGKTRMEDKVIPDTTDLTPNIAVVMVEAEHWR